MVLSSSYPAPTMRAAFVSLFRLSRAGLGGSSCHRTRPSGEAYAGVASFLFGDLSPNEAKGFCCKIWILAAPSAQHPAKEYKNADVVRLLSARHHTW